MSDLADLAAAMRALDEIITLVATDPGSCDDWPEILNEENESFCVGCTIGELAQGALIALGGSWSGGPRDTLESE